MQIISRGKPDIWKAAQLSNNGVDTQFACQLLTLGECGSHSSRWSLILTLVHQMGRRGLKEKKDREGSDEFG